MTLRLHSVETGLRPVSTTTPKIVLGIPTYNLMVRPETDTMVRKLIDNFDIDPRIVDGGACVSMNRNFTVTKGCQKTKQTFDFDYFLSLDGDVWNDDPVKMLGDMMSHDADMVSTPYPYRCRDRSETCLYGNDPLTIEKYVAGWFHPHIPAIKGRVDISCIEIIPVDFSGLGCCLIKKKVFEGLRYPYFREMIVENGDESYIATEDMGFFWACKKAGFNLLLDCRNNLHHQPIGG
jgi:hypothetical protein